MRAPAARSGGAVGVSHDSLRAQTCTFEEKPHLPTPTTTTQKKGLAKIGLAKVGLDRSRGVHPFLGMRPSRLSVSGKTASKRAATAKFQGLAKAVDTKVTRALAVAGVVGGREEIHSRASADGCGRTFTSAWSWRRARRILNMRRKQKWLKWGLVR